MIHGPNSPDKPPSAVRMAAMAHHDSWYSMDRYAERTSYLLVAIIALAILPAILHRLRVRQPKLSRRIVSLPLYRRTTAFLRCIGYVQPVVRGIFITALGPLLLIAAFGISTIAWCFAIKPYYRPSRELGSPPLAIRAGMIAQGMIPFLFAFSTKVNLVTFVTALSHERLQIYHQWIARIILFFGIVHTLPFIIQPLRDAGASNLKAWFYYDPVNWTGAVSLALLVWLVVSSTRVFRNMNYEFFVVQHIVTMLVFLGFYFKHCDMTLHSWDWLWAAVGLYGFATLVKWCRAAMASHYFVNAKAAVEIQTSEVEAEGDQRDEVLRISMWTPVRWQPGQHVFIRFPTVGPFQSHPFTILDLPGTDMSTESQLVLVAQVHNGVTRSIFEHVSKRSDASHGSDVLLLQPGQDEEKGVSEGCGELRTQAVTLPAIIDGPYGESATMASFESVVIVIGGMGITFALPVLMDLVRRVRAEDAVTKQVELVWSIKNKSLSAWFTTYLEAIHGLAEALPQFTISLKIHVTQDTFKLEPSAGSMASDQDLHKGLMKPSQPWTVYEGRPDVPALLVDAAHDTANHGYESMAAVVCGPKGMANQAANQLARLQWDVLRGKLALKDLYMLNESFSW